MEESCHMVIEDRSFFHELKAFLLLAKWGENQNLLVDCQMVSLWDLSFPPPSWLAQLKINEIVLKGYKSQLKRKKKSHWVYPEIQ